MKAGAIVKSRITPWALVAVLVVALVAWALATVITGRDDHGPKRWKSGGMACETEAFKRLSNASENSIALSGGTACEMETFKRLWNASGHPTTPATDNQPIAPQQPDWSRPNVTVYSVATVSPPHPRPTLHDLTDHGQAHAIDFLRDHSSSSPHAWADLQKALTDDGDAGSPDPFKFDRVLVATVSKGVIWEPGDRMVWTRVFIQPINFKFAGYSVRATENETLKVSSVEATTTQKLSADIGLAVPGMEGPKASIGPSNERTVTTTADVNTQYEALGIDIMPNFLRIIRESERGGDVVGNTSVSLSIVTDLTTILKKFPNDLPKKPNGDEVVLVVTGTHLEDGAKELKPDQATISVLPQAPLPHCALRARVWALYEQRSIKTGREYYDESQQEAVFLRDADEKQDLDIMGPDEVSPAVWAI